MLTYQKLVHLI